jgi:hypothetical protein
MEGGTKGRKALKKATSKEDHTHRSRAVQSQVKIQAEWADEPIG